MILEPQKIKSATVAHSCFKDIQSFRIFDMIKHPVLDVSAISFIALVFPGTICIQSVASLSYLCLLSGF